MQSKLCFSLDPFQLPTKTEPTKERTVQPAPARKPTVIRIPAKPGKCKHFSTFCICVSKSLREICALLSMCAFEMMCNQPFIIIHSQGHLKASWGPLNNSLDNSSSEFGFHFSLTLSLGENRRRQTQNNYNILVSLVRCSRKVVQLIANKIIHVYHIILIYIRSILFQLA